MSVTHTPGPWRIDWKSSPIEIESAAIPKPEFPVVAEIPDESGAELARADALLIATAPELLELAEQYASECGECAGTGIKPDDEPCEECKFIRDVLAKVRP